MGLTSSQSDPNFPGKYRVFTFPFAALTSSSTANPLAVAVQAGRIRDIVLGQITAGTVGTSWTATVKKNGTTVCATDGVISQSDGAAKSVDSSLVAAITKPTGATRPVLSTTLSAITLAKGDQLSVDITLAGSYSVGCSGVVSVVVEDLTNNNP